jgi:hypothetical protein
VTVWEPYVHLLARYPAPGAMLAGTDAAEIDDARPCSSTPTGPW